MQQRHYAANCTQPADDDEDITVVEADAAGTSKLRATRTQPQPQPKKRVQTATTTINSFDVKTAMCVKDELDQLLAELFHGTNTSFNAIEHPAWEKFMAICRPGYKLPTRHGLAGPLLDKVHQNVQKVCREKIKDETVCMSLDGWSNIHNEPVVCVAVTL